LEISDNGKAFDIGRLSSAEWGDRLGLTGMRERVEMVGGRFGVESKSGVGTTIRAVIPFGNKGPHAKMSGREPSSVGGGGGMGEGWEVNKGPQRRLTESFCPKALDHLARLHKVRSEP
jgi:hypothetical protein